MLRMNSAREILLKLMRAEAGCSLTAVKLYQATAWVATVTLPMISK
jgi:hypothetical protein